VSQPVVSIISPCFNQERFIGPTIASVRSQTEERWELIIVDDGSSDQSRSMATVASGGDPRVCVLQIPHRGVAHARNAGVVKASPASRYLLFLDADDELESTMLERCIRELDANPQLSMAHSLLKFIDEAGDALVGTPGIHPRYVRHRWMVRALTDTEPETPFASILALAGIIPSCSMLRRSAFVAVGGWDEGFGQGFEDTDLFLRLALHGPVHQIPERLVLHRRHPGQSSEVAGRHDGQLVKLHARWRDLGRLTPEHRVVVTAAWRFYDRQLNWHTAWQAAWRSLRDGRPMLAARFLAGSLLITARSWAVPRRFATGRE
jgi:glycosyltransferase involved in cell wall biosynthesis